MPLGCAIVPVHIEAAPSLSQACLPWVLAAHSVSFDHNAGKMLDCVGLNSATQLCSIFLMFWEP